MREALRMWKGLRVPVATLRPPRRALASAARATSHGLESGRRVGGNFLDRVQAALARIDYRLSGPRRDPFSLHPPDDLSPDELDFIEKSKSEPSVWREFR